MKNDWRNIALVMLLVVCTVLALLYMAAPVDSSKELERLEEENTEMQSRVQRIGLALKVANEELEDLKRNIAAADKAFAEGKSKIDDSITNIPEEVDATYAMPLPEQRDFWTEQAEQPDLSPIRLDLPE